VRMYVCVYVCVCVPDPLCSTGRLSLQCVLGAGSPPGGCPPVTRCRGRTGEWGVKQVRNRR
jgi:hypothetical protein